MYGGFLFPLPSLVLAHALHTRSIASVTVGGLCSLSLGMLPLTIF